MSDLLKINRYKDLEKGFADLGLEIKISSACFQIYHKSGALLAIPETIDGAYDVFCAIERLHENKLLK